LGPRSPSPTQAHFRPAPLSAVQRRLCQATTHALAQATFRAGGFGMGVDFCPGCFDIQRLIDELKGESPPEAAIALSRAASRTGAFRLAVPSSPTPRKGRGRRWAALARGRRETDASRSKRPKPPAVRPSRRGRPVRTALALWRRGASAPFPFRTCRPHSASSTNWRGKTARDVASSSRREHPPCCTKACSAIN